DELADSSISDSISPSPHSSIQNNEDSGDSQSEFHQVADQMKDACETPSQGSSHQNMYESEQVADSSITESIFPVHRNHSTTEDSGDLQGSSSNEESTSDTSSYSVSESEYCPSSDNENYDTDEFSSDLECFEAHYLEEEEEHHQENQNNDDIVNQVDILAGNGNLEDPDDDPDDPGNPDDPDDRNEEGSSSEDSEEEDVAEVANFHTEQLNRNVRLFQNLTVGEVLCLELASAVRHRKTFESIIDQCKNLNLLFGPHCFPESKTKLWSSIMLNKAGIQFHLYCGYQPCGRYIGRRERFHHIVRCRCNNYEAPVKKAKFFVTLDIKSQLKYFLSIPGIWEKLQYPQTRQKISPTAIEDILDGAHYLRLKEDGGPLADPNNFSYIFSFDGVKVSKKGSLKATPLYIRINELPPELRQKFHFPVAIFIDNKEPKSKCFLKPFVRQARRLAQEGLDWIPDGANNINSKFIPLGFCVDSPVRYDMLCLSKWDSECGCTYCTHRGVRVAGSQRYPFVNMQGIPPFHDRSHEGMIAAMINVHQNNDVQNYEGHKGLSPLMLLEPYLDLREGQAVDDLHQDHEGSAADLTELLLTTPDARRNRNLANVALLRAIDDKMLSIKTPGRISRKPRSITKMSSYTGSEWRNWLFYYGVPCLLDLIKPEYLDILAALSHACYLLSQDSIEPQHIEHAERLFQRVATRFENTFGVGCLKYNLHVTTMHKVRCVRNLGNPFAYSTYNFESLHRKVIGKVTSPKGAIMQVITRSMLYLSVNASQYDERLSEDVRIRVQEILNPYQLQKVQQVGPHSYVVGRGNERQLHPDEVEVMAREEIQVNNVVEYKSVLVKSTRYWSSTAQNQNIKSNDSFIYTSQNTFCSIRNIVSFVNDNGEEKCGAFVYEHDVAQIVPVARHLSILRNNDADILHFIYLSEVRCPAIMMNMGGIVYASSVPNCFEID
ncbi:Halomucin, partial [Frankliniella fusca]